MAIEPIRPPASYSADPPAMGPPFPTSNAAWDPPQPTGYFTERTVHQVYFKIFSFYNDRRELWITEIDHRGYARTREPETYFYFLTGDDSYARHTSDYWRAFFQIPTRHFDNPFHYTATDNYQHHHLHLLPLHPPQQPWPLNFKNDSSPQLHLNMDRQSSRTT